MLATQQYKYNTIYKYIYIHIYLIHKQIGNKLCNLKNWTEPCITLHTHTRYIVQLVLWQIDRGKDVKTSDDEGVARTHAQLLKQNSIKLSQSKSHISTYNGLFYTINNISGESRTTRTTDAALETIDNCSISSFSLGSLLCWSRELMAWGQGQGQAWGSRTSIYGSRTMT